MTCQELLVYLSDYIDGDLDADLAAAARDHLATCHNCQVVLHTTQNTIQLGHQQRQLTLAPERRAHLVAQIQQALKLNPSRS